MARYYQKTFVEDCSGNPISTRIQHTLSSLNDQALTLVNDKNAELISLTHNLADKFITVVVAYKVED